MRCFAAVDVPRDLHERLLALQNELAGCDVTIVPANNLHLTLRFFGDVSEPVIGQIRDRLASICRAPFTAELAGVGAFPSARSVRVIWVGSPTPDMLTLHHDVQNALGDLFPSEKPIPHVTLARARSSLDAERLHAFVAMHSQDRIGSFVVDALSIKQSTLSPRGPTYRDVARIPLAIA